MRTRALHFAVAGMALALALFGGVAAAQSYNITFAGAPSSIACSNTDFTLGPGLTYSWNLPSATTKVLIVGTAGSTVIQSGAAPFGTATGTGVVVGGAGTLRLDAVPVHRHLYAEARGLRRDHKFLQFPVRECHGNEFQLQ